MFFIKSVWRVRRHETQRYQTSILVLKSISIWEISYLRALPWYDVFRFDVRIREIFMSDDIAAYTSSLGVNIKTIRLFISADVKLSDITLDTFVLGKYTSLFTAALN